MTIRPASDSPAAAAAAVGPVRSDAASAEGSRSESSPVGAAPSDGDRLEISDAARARADAAGPAEAGSLEIEVARLALRQGGEMDAARLHELCERVRTGYYDSPSAVDRIAEAAARDLAQSGGSV